MRQTHPASGLPASTALATIPGRNRYVAAGARRPGPSAAGRSRSASVGRNASRALTPAPSSVPKKGRLRREEALRKTQMKLLAAEHTAGPSGVDWGALFERFGDQDGALSLAAFRTALGQVSDLPSASLIRRGRPGRVASVRG